MKRSVILFLALSFILLPMINAAACDLSISLINQDPYPAIPGDYVKVVFQIDGVENPECGVVNFELKENYPFSLDPNVSNKVSINAGTYSRTYSSFYLATYKLRVSEDALDGNNPIEVAYSSKFGADILKEFNINVEDTKADFEVHVKNYNYVTHILTLEILNIEDVDVEALTLEIPKQEEMQVKGANKKVIGDLDSNEYTTADFEIIMPEGESTLNITLIYTDSINERRSLTEEVLFDSSYFTDRNGSKKSFPWFWTIVVLAVIVWFIYRRYKKKKIKQKLMKH